MPAPSLTYTLSNGTTADASQVQQNFTDLLNGITDGSKDLSISALTCAGNATFNGNATFGNATSDTVTLTSRIASDIVPSTADARDLGSSSLPFKHIFLNNGATDGGRTNYNGGTTSYAGSSSDGSDWQLGGFTGFNLGTALIKRFSKYHEAKLDDYPVTDTDGVSVILMTRGASNRIITLPTAADNSGRQIDIIIVDDNTGIVTIDGEGSETINGATTIKMAEQYEEVSLICNGTAWFITRDNRTMVSTAYSSSSTSLTDSTVTKVTGIVADRDRYGMWSASNDQFTIPEAGWWEIGSTLYPYISHDTTTPPNDTLGEILVYKNTSSGTLLHIEAVTSRGNAASSRTDQFFSVPFVTQHYLAANDTIDFYGYIDCNGGASLNRYILGGTIGNYGYCYVRKLRAS